ncbi:MAG: hypothetical protein RL564_225, partial [Pseudomonadota bacterium]
MKTNHYVFRAAWLAAAGMLSA